MTSNTYGRQVVIPMTNGSGGGVIAGDVVIVKTSANLSFTTTTSAGFTGLVGVAQETIANAAVGKVLLSGYAPLINTSASVTRGNFGATHTVAKQAADAGAARGTGTFCQFLTGGTTPDAVVYPVDLLGTSLTNPMNAVGDIIQGTTAGAPAKLAAGTAGYVLTSAGAATPLVWAASAAPTLVAGVIALTTGDITTTSTSFTNLTGVTTTITTGAHRCMVYFTGSWALGGVGTMGFDVAIDTVRMGQTHGLTFRDSLATNISTNISVAVLTGVLSAASHVFQVMWKVSTGTGTFYAATTSSPAYLSVVETALLV